MTEFSVLWYKNTSLASGILALFLLLILECFEIANCTWILLGNKYTLLRRIDFSVSDFRITLVFSIKLIWNLIFTWFIIKGYFGIRKKLPNHLKSFLFAQIFVLTAVMIRLISRLVLQEHHLPKGTPTLLMAFNVNAYWILLVKADDAANSSRFDVVALSNLLQIGIGCCFFVVIYFNYEVLRYEAIRCQYQEIIGNVLPIEVIHLKAKPNEYVTCRMPGTHRSSEAPS